ncbi:Fanconi anemia group J protein homolog isoform X2 [Dendronephthya gigantea]|uniref:Fanconi anemia group J protein homolog isoform X2 n=1 Tax=Dendronephthya gigantea TaxID=151771 RepID=UPI00106A481D|nr:Fanconi anemia group J protein homolog isoform X2 [Dendronephthya gigantea]
MAEYAISGVKVKFPYKPYPSQFTMMDKVIKCIERRQHSLLESPTGSGKSLALLCSSLAWLTVEKEKIKKEREEFQRLFHLQQLRRNKQQTQDDDAKLYCSCDNLGVKEEQKPDMKVKIEQLNQLGDVTPKTEPNLGIDPDEAIDQKPMKAEIKAESTNVDVKKDGEASGGSEVQSSAEDLKNDVQMEDDIDHTDEDTDFEAPKKRFRTPGGQTPRAKKPRKQCDGEAPFNGSEDTSVEYSPRNEAGDVTDDDIQLLQAQLRSLRSAPKILFGTRTHKQIGQIVRELNKTEYKKTKMCILASRQHTCIHPYVSAAQNKNEECRKSIENKEGKSCSFFARARYVKHQDDLEDYGFTEAWDLTELVELGEKLEGCPYYMTRELKQSSDIIFCPYNYLIDPCIRKQMDITLLDQVVILDEAHNIEDVCREAATWSVSTQNLDEAMLDLDFLVSRNTHKEQHQVFHQVCAAMRRWIDEKSEHQTAFNDATKRSKIWEGEDLKQALENLGFTPATVRALEQHLRKLGETSDSLKEKHKKERTTMHAPTATLVEKLMMVLSFIMDEDYKHLPEYRMAITKDYVEVPRVLPNGFRRARDFDRKWICTLNFWCLSPAVVFSEIGRFSRSVILTSGTLSPMSTFSSELDCQFPIKLEANHVIGSSQVWASSVSTGPSGALVNATFRQSQTFEFQDEVGEAICKVCEVVPYGVLCFFPSYSMLDKLTTRWQMTGLWLRLSRLKRTFLEPRKGGKTDFNNMMNDFYECIKHSEETDGSGALFLAVCRGKVSEGLDFADNNARAVITVGIPFPNVKDIQVELKRSYNNRHSSQKGLLDGSEWYETQAYRALNQALGRCIRHRNDWGALILIDDRFGKSPKYHKGLSKWIRGRVVHHDNFHVLLSSLKKFAQARLESPCPNNTMIQTPPGAPKRDLNAIKCSQDSSLSMDSSSPCSQSTSQDDVKCSTTATPIPNHPQSSTQVTSSTPIAGRGLVPKLLNLTDNPQTIIYPQQVVNPQPVGNHPEPVNNPRQMGNIQPATHPQPFINPLIGNNPQMPGIPQPLARENKPVLVRFVSPSGQPVQHVLFSEQQLKLLTQQMANGGQQVMPKAAGMVQLAGVDQGITLNMAGQPGLNSIGQLGFQSTSREQCVPQKDSSGQCGTPGVVRVKEEPKSPSNEVQAQSSSSGTPGVNPGLSRTQGNRMQRRPLFSSNNSELNHSSGDSLTRPNNDMCGAGKPSDEGLSAPPDSPLLFCSPPTSLEREDGVPLGTTGTEGALAGNIMAGVLGENAGSKDIEKREKLDGSAETDNLDEITWNVNCKECGATFYSSRRGDPDDHVPQKMRVPGKTSLGGVLNSAFSLKKGTRKKKSSTLETIRVPDTCCLELIPDVKKGNVAQRNAFYCKEDSLCFIPLICQQCKDICSMKAYVIAVRAIPCGTGNDDRKSMVWFDHENVDLNQM